jgi:hypothetical protein
MRLLTILLLTTIFISASGQRLTGKYNAYYGHSLELKDDSTFAYEWRFDMTRKWAVGKWRYSNRIVQLNFTTIYDTLIRDGQPDSIVLSSDPISSKVSQNQFAIVLIGAGGQDNSRIADRLALRRKRLYQMDKSGKLLTDKKPGIWSKKKRPIYFFRVD